MQGGAVKERFCDGLIVRRSRCGWRVDRPSGGVSGLQGKGPAPAGGLALPGRGFVGPLRWLTLSFAVRKSGCSLECDFNVIKMQRALSCVIKEISEVCYVGRAVADLQFSGVHPRHHEPLCAISCIRSRRWRYGLRRATRPRHRGPPAGYHVTSQSMVHVSSSREA